MGYYDEVFRVKCGECEASYILKRQPPTEKWNWECKQCPTRNWHSGFQPLQPALSTCALILLNCYLICEFPCLSLGGNKHAAEHHLCPLRQGASDLCHGSSSLGEAPGCPPHR